MSDFGPVLRKFRKAAGLSQERLADVSGVSVEAIKTLEAGRRRSPRAKTLELLSDGLGLDGDGRAELQAAAAPSSTERLPNDVPDFVGRAEQIAAVSELLTGGGQAPGVVVISAIAGMGGVGKTALAVRVARELAGRFADGVLYVNLRGFGVGEPMTPLEALNTLLQQLSFAQRPLESTEEAAGLFRTVCAGRKLLVVLDNAVGVDQVQPLLPGTSTCAVIVTSRRALVGLPGARSLELAVLPDDEALALLKAVAGSERIETDLQSARDVVARCGSLPLAIRIAGSRLAAEPSWTVADLARRLAHESARLDLLGDGVRASIALSLAGTSATDVAAAEIFGLLGLHEGEELDLKVAARLVDRPEAEVEPLLEHLVDLHLLESASPRRYQFHDLVRTYARELAPDDRTAARERVLALYVAMAWQARAKLGVSRAFWFEEEWIRGVEHLEYDEVMAWLDAEAAEILAAARRPTIDRGTLVNLAGGMLRFWVIRRRHAEGTELGQLALAALREDPACASVFALSRISYHVGAHYSARSDSETAVAYLRVALAAAPMETDPFNHVVCTITLAQDLERLGRLDEATELARSGLEGALHLENEIIESDARYSIGSLAGRLGRFAEQDEAFDLAVAILRRSRPEILHLMLPDIGASYLRSDRPEAARTWLRDHLEETKSSGDNAAIAEHLYWLGVAETALADHDAARVALTEALDVIQNSNDELEAKIRHALGTALSGLGESEPAQEQWRMALDLYQRSGSPQAGEVRTLLND
ncbi:NB-ARC domain-containing protein [Kribbella sp. NPDC005582]|uniref:NB-ARC domain-containing protein n=1 Tax=Kribbella sp. NPDC005582 TaxID=3156893 RepID=UPI0033A87097